MSAKNTTEDMVSMFMNFGKDMKLPSPDIEAVVDRHKKSLEAMETAAKTAGTSASAIVSRQREMVQEALNEITAMAENLKGGSDPQTMMAAQADFAKRSFEMAIKNTSELAGLAQKSSTEALKVLQENMQETLEEARKVMTQTTKK